MTTDFSEFCNLFLELWPFDSVVLGTDPDIQLVKEYVCFDLVLRVVQPQNIDQLFQSGQALATDDPPLPNLVAKGIHHGRFGIPEKIPGIVTLSLFTLSHPTGVLEKAEGS